jgi:hypothetical protein
MPRTLGSGRFRKPAQDHAASASAGESARSVVAVAPVRSWQSCRPVTMQRAHTGPRTIGALASQIAGTRAGSSMRTTGRLPRQGGFGRPTSRPSERRHRTRRSSSSRAMKATARSSRRNEGRSAASPTIGARETLAPPRFCRATAPDPLRDREELPYAWDSLQFLGAAVGEREACARE